MEYNIVVKVVKNHIVAMPREENVLNMGVVMESHLPPIQMEHNLAVMIQKNHMHIVKFLMDRSAKPMSVVSRQRSCIVVLTIHMIVVQMGKSHKRMKEGIKSAVQATPQWQWARNVVHLIKWRRTMA